MVNEYIIINGSGASKKIIDELVKYVIDDDLYSHEKHFDINPETGVKEEIVYKVNFPLVTESARASLRSMLQEANFTIEEDLYGEMQDDMEGVFEKYDLLNNIKKSFLKSFVSADYSIGLEASFAIGANATQVTLNSFHTSGALKRTEDAISSIVSISKGSSRPERSLTTVMFDREHRPKNFYDVMKNKRKEFTEANFDYFVQSENVISLATLLSENSGNSPEWYDFFEITHDLDLAKILIEARSIENMKLNDFWTNKNIHAESIKLTKYILNVDNLYSFQVTPGEIVSKLEEVSNDKFLFVYSPLMKEKIRIVDSVMQYDGTSTELVTEKEITRCELHVYLLLNKVEKIKDVQKVEESILVTDALGVFNKVLVRGIKGIQQVIPDSIEISMMIEEAAMVYETPNGAYWNVYFDPINIKLYDVKPEDIAAFLEVCEYTEILPEKGVDPLSEINEQVNNQFFITDEENPYHMIVTIFTKDGNPKPRIYEKIEAEKVLYRQGINQKIEERNELYRKGKEDEAYNVNVFSDKPHEVIRSKNEIVFVVTLGANIREILKVPGVDPYHTYSTDFHEMNEMLSIEGVRNIIGMEFFAASGYGGYIDPRHILLAVDRMSHTSYVRGFTKKLFSMENYSAFAKSLTQSPSEVMAKSSGLGEMKKILSPIEAVFTGGYANTGTTSTSTRVEFDESFSRLIKKRTKQYKKYEPKDLMKRSVLKSNLINDIVETKTQIVETPSGTFETTKGGIITEVYEKEEITHRPQLEEEILLRKKISPYFSIYSQAVDSELGALLKSSLESTQETTLEESTSFTRFFRDVPQQPIGLDKVEKVYEYSEPEVQIERVSDQIDLDRILADI